MRIGRLTVMAPESAAPPHPRRGDPGVFTWLNLDGTLWGHGFHALGARWLSFPRVARFRLGAHDAEATAVPDVGADLDAVVDAYRRCVVPMALHAQGIEVLHASAVVMPAGVVAFCARARTGKSTTAFALSLRGHRLWADDAVPFEFVDDAPLALPLPFRLRLRRRAGEFFDVRVPPDAFAPMTNGSSGHCDPLPLAGLVLLERAPKLPSPAEVGRLAPAEALTSLIEHAYWYDLGEPGRKRLMMERYAELVGAIPTWRLVFRSELEGLDELVGMIEGAVGASSTTA